MKQKRLDYMGRKKLEGVLRAGIEAGLFNGMSTTDVAAFVSKTPGLETVKRGAIQYMLRQDETLIWPGLRRTPSEKTMSTVGKVLRGDVNVLARTLKALAKMLDVDLEQGLSVEDVARLDAISVGPVVPPTPAPPQ